MQEVLNKIILQQKFDLSSNLKRQTFSFNWFWEKNMKKYQPHKCEKLSSRSVIKDNSSR